MGKHRRKRYTKIGKGEICPKCGEFMDRRTHLAIPSKWHYTEWDYCWRCKHLQHYEKYKCAEWQEAERAERTFEYLRET